MANSPEYYAKLMIGDLLLQLAALRAENEVLRANQKPPKKVKP